MTRSSLPATASLEASLQMNMTPPSVVEINWLFFDSSRVKVNISPLSIEIPSQLFEEKSDLCRELFVEALFEEHGVVTDRASIRFWKPMERLLCTVACQREWISGIGDHHSAFELIPLTSSLHNMLGAQMEDQDAVHLIVTVESREEGDKLPEIPQNQRYLRYISTKGPSPSSKEYTHVQGDSALAIYDGRYPSNAHFSTVALPIQIFHPVFEEFARRANDPGVRPTRGELIRIQKLMYSASIIGEATRAADLREQLSHILGVTIVQDGAYMLELSGASVALMLCELDKGGCDASTQASIAMRAFWVQEDRARFRDRTCCPTLLLACGGPWMAVLGGVLTDKVIVQRLTDMMWIGHSSTHEDARVYRVTRVLAALRDSLNQLRNFYVGVDAKINAGKVPPFNPHLTHPRFYPYPHSFVENDQTFYFQYVRALEDYPLSVAFLARVQGDDDSPNIVVKFVSRYGRDAHAFLAEQNYAPRLRYCGPLDHTLDNIGPQSPTAASSGLHLGPLQMVVMDYIDTAGLTRNRPPEDAHHQIREVLTQLHTRGFIFGDLRGPNVLFDRNKKVKFIDFDWAARYDMTVRDKSEYLPKGLQSEIDANVERYHQPQANYARYPLGLSRRIKWADGAGDLLPIRPAHDWEMMARFNFVDH